MKILLTLLFFSHNANAYYRGNCDYHQLGWNFYCDKKISQAPFEQLDKKEQKTQPQTLAEIATAKTKATTKKHQELLDIATHFPTEENIIN